jgi:hypothetical protein
MMTAQVQEEVSDIKKQPDKIIGSVLSVIFAPRLMKMNHRYVLSDPLMVSKMFFEA